MIRKLSFLIIGFAAAMSSIAIAAPLPAINGGETETAPATTQTSTGASDRLYCYNGVKGDQANLYRGWVCEPEQAKTR